MGSDAVSGRGSAVNIETTSSSARTRMIRSVGAPVVTGERIPPVVGQDGGGDEMNEEYLRTDIRIGGFSMLDICIKLK